MNVTAASALAAGVVESLGGLAAVDAAARSASTVNLAEVPDDLLRDMRRALALLGPEAWRALAAVDAVLVERARHRPHPAGRPDLGGGHARRVGRLARELGTRRREMLLNADAHRLTLLPYVSLTRGTITIGDVLARPEPFYAALRWPEGERARVLTAWAVAAEDGVRVVPVGPPRRTLALVTAAPAPEHGTECQGCQAASHIRRTLETFKGQIIPDVPSPIWVARLYLDWLDDLNDSLSDLEGHAPYR